MNNKNNSKISSEMLKQLLASLSASGSGLEMGQTSVDGLSGLTDEQIAMLQEMFSQLNKPAQESLPSEKELDFIKKVEGSESGGGSKNMVSNKAVQTQAPNEEEGGAPMIRGSEPKPNMDEQGGKKPGGEVASGGKKGSKQMQNNGRGAEGKSSLGKFKSVDELKKGYIMLESSFTKKCQENKSLMQTISCMQREVDEMTAKLDNILADEQFVQEQVMQDTNIKNRIIYDYLKQAMGQDTVKLLGTDVGFSAVTPIQKPKSLSEAGKIVESLLHG